jgi:type IV pilus assembly protein PilV
MMKHQRGVFLLEALVAILIFSLGVLGMVAMGAASVAAQSDAQYRTEAANLANEISSDIALTVVRTDEFAFQDSLATFQHHATSTGNCAFGGAASTAPLVTSWATKVSSASGLPGATAGGQQILVNTAGGINRIQVTVCWQAPTDRAARRHTLVTYVNR